MQRRTKKLDTLSSYRVLLTKNTVKKLILPSSVYSVIRQITLAIGNKFRQFRR